MKDAALSRFWPHPSAAFSWLFNLMAALVRARSGEGLAAAGKLCYDRHIKKPLGQA